MTAKDFLQKKYPLIDLSALTADGIEIYALIDTGYKPSWQGLKPRTIKIIYYDFAEFDKIAESGLPVILSGQVIYGNLGKGIITELKSDRKSNNPAKLIYLETMFSASKQVRILIFPEPLDNYSFFYFPFDSQTRQRRVEKQVAISAGPRPALITSNFSGYGQQISTQLVQNYRTEVSYENYVFYTKFYRLNVKELYILAKYGDEFILNLININQDLVNKIDDAINQSKRDILQAEEDKKILLASVQRDRERIETDYKLSSINTMLSLVSLGDKINA